MIWRACLATMKSPAGCSARYSTMTMDRERQHCRYVNAYGLDVSPWTFMFAGTT